MVDFDFLEGAWCIFVFGTHKKMIILSSRKYGVLQEREWEGTLKYFSEFCLSFLKSWTIIKHKVYKKERTLYESN